MAARARAQAAAGLLPAASALEQRVLVRQDARAGHRRAAPSPLGHKSGGVIGIPLQVGIEPTISASQACGAAARPKIAPRAPRSSRAGNRTLVLSVTAIDTNHYTTRDVRARRGRAHGPFWELNPGPLPP